MLNTGKAKLASRRAMLKSIQDGIQNYVYTHITQSKELTQEQIKHVALHFNIKEDALLNIIKGIFTIKEMSIEMKVAAYAKAHFETIGRLEVYQLEKQFNRSRRSILRYLNGQGLTYANQQDFKTLTNELIRRQQLYELAKILKQYPKEITGKDILQISLNHHIPVKTLEKYISLLKTKNVKPIKLTPIEKEYLESSFYYRAFIRKRNEKSKQDLLLIEKVKKAKLKTKLDKIKLANKLHISETKLTRLINMIKLTKQ